ncbi:MAG: radical SAM family heme chaperone HemW [Planctomycetia bacterium]|jgi:oxygen-independent coproporphyrinogen III oxidase|nr:radical SAM family heme chaperone HemW [Planctomycetia bacterium]
MIPALALPRSVYVHVPFCRHRCGYCDFSLLAGRDDLFERYFLAMACELKRVPLPLALDTLYLGGGTPSHLGPAGLRRLFNLLHGPLVPVGTAEITMEANPSDVTGPLAALAKGFGVTRFSLGAQSLDAATLRSLDRDHSPDDVRQATATLLGAGLSVSVDLLIAAPGQSLAAVEQDLEAVIALGVQHVSVYCLTWEKGTQFDALRAQGILSVADESIERAMFEATIDRLEAAGFEHYEVSNFARPGFRCRHNEAYWDCRPWEAFGPGAARYDGRERITNHRSTTGWMTRVLEGQDFTGDRDAMTPEEAARERVVVGLRRRDGLDREDFRAASGLALDTIAGAAIVAWVADGLATDDGQRVRLTREGLLLSDALWQRVLTGRG